MVYSGDLAAGSTGLDTVWPWLAMNQAVFPACRQGWWRWSAGSGITS